MQISVNCGTDKQTCREIGGSRVFTLQNGRLYQGSDGKFYSLTYTAGGFGLMQSTIDARMPANVNPSPSRNSLMKGNTAGDQYGAGGFHDWYLILLALAVLYGIMRLQPKWGMPLGWLVLLGAILSTKPAVDGFNSLVKSIQTGSLQ